MKRFLALLVLIAGGLAAASFAVPTNAAVVNGQSISQDQTTSDLSAIAKSANYGCYLNEQLFLQLQGRVAQLPVDGAGQLPPAAAHTTTSSAFAAYYLSTVIRNTIVFQLAAAHHVQPSKAELQSARTDFLNEISATLQDASSSGQTCTATSGEAVLSDMPASFVQTNVQVLADEIKLSEAVSGIGSSDAKLRSYFLSHRSLFDQGCFTVAGYSSKSAAEAARVAVYEGEPFSTVAAQQAGGGPQGCAIFYTIVSQLPAGSGLDSLPLNTLSNPISLNGQYLLVEVTKRTLLTFTDVKREVSQAVQQLGRTKVINLINGNEQHANVSIDPRYGVWNASLAGMGLPPQPPTTTILNAGANNPPTASTSPFGASGG